MKILFALTPFYICEDEGKVSKVSVFQYSGIATILILMETSVLLRIFDFGDAYSLPMLLVRFAIYSMIAFVFNKFISTNLEEIEEITNNKEWKDVRYLLFRKQYKGKNNA